MIDHGAADLVQDVPLPAFLLGLEAVHPFLDALTVVQPRFFRSRTEANSDRRLLPYCLQALSARQEAPGPAQCPL